MLSFLASWLTRKVYATLSTTCIALFSNILNFYSNLGPHYPCFSIFLNFSSSNSSAVALLFQYGVEEYNGNLEEQSVLKRSNVVFFFLWLMMPCKSRTESSSTVKVLYNDRGRSMCFQHVTQDESDIYVATWMSQNSGWYEVSGFSQSLLTE